jgi:hypothetical protein|tara:strand:- start:795 stop:1052 length:258 start_codon:yes stop_codon:yes gene_type:complete
MNEWMEATGNQLDLDESVGRKGWVKFAALGLAARAHQHRNRVKGATDTNTKLDALSDLVTTIAHLTTLSIATDLNDRSLLKGKKR